MRVPNHSGSVRGFTLIELLIAVAVAAILAGLAYPSYADYVRRGKITEAHAQLSTVRVKLEQYYQDNRNYGSTATTCGVAMPSSDYFSFACAWGPGGTSQSFVVTATGLGGVGGYVYTVDDANAQRTTQFAGTAVTAACWLKKSGESC